MNAELESLENCIGMPLPQALALAIESATIPRQNVMFETEDKKVAGWIIEFLLKECGAQDNGICEAEYRELALGGMIPSNLLPIAVVANGDRILISLAGKDEGHVYYWGWSEEPEPPTNSYKYMRRISESFSSFLKGLQTAK